MEDMFDEFLLCNQYGCEEIFLKKKNCYRTKIVSYEKLLENYIWASIK